MIPVFVYFYSKAKKIEEPSKRERPLIDTLAEFYTNSSFYRQTKAELDQFSCTQKKKKNAAFTDIAYVTSFCHQLRWIARRSFKNLLGNPQASIAQVTGWALPVVLCEILTWGELGFDNNLLQTMCMFYPYFCLLFSYPFGYRNGP